jgi:hypothetical protein
MAGVWMCGPCADVRRPGWDWSDTHGCCPAGMCGACGQRPLYVRYFSGESCNPAKGAGSTLPAAAPTPRAVVASPPAAHGAPRSVEKEGAGSQIELFG